ncbi:MAG: DUF234 domain-containing protein [Arcobacteraceae bacterium]
MEKAIEYFTVFGGLNIKIDTNKPLLELIQTHLLNNYRMLRTEIGLISGGYRVDHAILTGAALGDRRTQTAFKKAHVSFEEGMKCVEGLCEKGIVELESSQHFLTQQRGDTKVAKKLLFTAPFVRFWFAFISPIYKGIKEGNYEEFYALYENRKAQFSDFVFEELALEFLIDFYKEDALKQMGKYWDDKIQLDLIAKTTSGKIIVGSCKYNDTKVKKSELTKLKEDSLSLNITPDLFIIFAKKGFSNELKALKSETIRLFSAKSLKLLLE